MVERSEDLPILYFARSYVVVMEEAVRQLKQNRQETPVFSHSTLSHAEESLSSETPREDQLFTEEEGKESSLRKALTPTDSRNCSCSSRQSSGDSRASLSPPLTPPSETRLDWRAISPTSSSCRPPTTAHAAPATAAADTGLFGSEWWRREMQRKRPHKVLDFSLENLKGCVNIFNLPHSARPIEVRALLEPFGGYTVAMMISV
ncbi:hypothetical protein PENTCL1PPCAC_24119 [Pristionchus entomophagus]|uniref:Uncharacterized protein n=1 Tax=Pristionchus entomophagus TaxID=358040 RepID=A0AAV5U6C6_9BILA|nr:hypothetical protein PENTCL1PPCAC_24119 [Pristionchus entomophagus]